MRSRTSALVEHVILDPELPTHLSWSQSKYTKNIEFSFMQRENNSPGPETVQLSAGLYYMGNTDLPE